MKTTSRTRVRARLARVGAIASLVALPLGVGTVAFAGAADAATSKRVLTNDGRAVDALGGMHSRGLDEQGGLTRPWAEVKWWAAGERFTETKHNGCNPYTFSYGGVDSDPRCPSGQVKADWNADFVLRVASDVDVGVTADVDHRRQKGPTATAVGPL
ncbi:hypothetical protein SAMN06264364_12470, partial [Quadrisphaera granulorum]